MFIKVFVPNANGKIELTVQELEALLKDAADKAVAEHCGKCYKNNWWGSTTTLLNTPAQPREITPTQPTWNPYIVTCSDSTNNQKSSNVLEENITYLNGGLTIAQPDNRTGVTTCASTLSANIKKLIGE